MTTIKFTSIDTVARIATFDADGQSVTRPLADKFDSTTDEQIIALANGLVVEIEVEAAKKTVIETPTFKAGDVLVSTTEI